jgi:hypothetical protein
MNENPKKEIEDEKLSANKEYMTIENMDSYDS